MEETGKLQRGVVEEVSAPIQRRTQPADYLLRYVERDEVFTITCSDCECRSEEFFNQQQAAELCATAGWLVLGDNARIVCNRCAAYYPAHSIKK